MPPIPYIPESAPFTHAQRLWLNGYIAGLVSDAGTPREARETAIDAPAMPLLILYGSQTGTAEGLARKLGKAAIAKGFKPAGKALDETTPEDLTEASLAVVITSTYGDGEPPDNAQRFWKWIQQPEAPRLDHLRYSVLALGDKNYPQFCEFGRQCDARFAALGARCLLPRVDCDVDYEVPAETWRDALFAALEGAPSATSGPSQAPSDAASAGEAAWSRNRPYPSRLLENRRLTATTAGKDVRHIALALDDPALAYEPGDALGIFPQNDPALVSSILSLLGCDGEEAISLPNVAPASLRIALQQHLDITKLTAEVLALFGAKAADTPDFDLLDLLENYAAPSLPAAEWLPTLRRVAPRLYSIASSPLAAPGEVHLTVGIVRYDLHGRARGGVCSTFLADRAANAASVPVFTHPTRTFKLPTDGATPVIMVGPGTGIAPFRAFLQHRQIIGASGRNWLFFGDQTRDGHFLYRESIEQWHRDGVLNRLDLAFSRDQAEKVYVQHRIIENATELWRWIEEGAHFYVCGDASRMAKDVDAALNQVCQTAGSLSPESATEYIDGLKKNKRYQRDVY
jgi:sulfite reductase (NADPH) flavoprotein alpha-component